MQFGSSDALSREGCRHHCGLVKSKHETETKEWNGENNGLKTRFSVVSCVCVLLPAHVCWCADTEAAWSIGGIQRVMQSTEVFYTISRKWQIKSSLPLMSHSAVTTSLPVLFTDSCLLSSNSPLVRFSVVFLHPSFMSLQNICAD